MCVVLVYVVLGVRARHFLLGAPQIPHHVAAAAAAGAAAVVAFSYRGGESLSVRLPRSFSPSKHRCNLSRPFVPLYILVSRGAGTHPSSSRRLHPRPLPSSNPPKDKTGVKKAGVCIIVHRSIWTAVVSSLSAGGGGCCATVCFVIYYCIKPSSTGHHINQNRDVRMRPAGWRGGSTKNP